MRQVNVGLRFFAVQKNLTRPTWLIQLAIINSKLNIRTDKKIFILAETFKIMEFEEIFILT